MMGINGCITHTRIGTGSFHFGPRVQSGELLGSLKGKA
ncbi:hypothetical protein B4167_3543 [Caldibacillus thermoamylovorans]|uniref:Uncharacterized protein n=1 Tax=Caldibacillus thermoamylovorans TaxID=35841 RepID=A0ABD4A4K3_9BACI|nr:hypothetical protein B4167_3763 [Caldibacillus thermoamylovorans]KIO71594.1 hypothetical protein B4167_3543 [Caldibacillus thermoamylovorans]